MTASIAPLLMFEGKAEAAIAYYVSLFPGSSLDRIDHYGPGEHGPEGTVKQAAFTVAGQKLLAIDSPIRHGFGFTPAISLFVTFETEAELDRVYNQLVENGQVLMPLASYGFSQKFSWLNDRYGVSWQLNLP